MKSQNFFFSNKFVHNTAEFHAVKQQYNFELIIKFEFCCRHENNEINIPKNVNT